MKNCLAMDCENDCNPACESYICKTGATEGAPVPGTDGKVCYGKLILPQSIEQGYYLPSFSSARIEIPYMHLWVNSGWPHSDEGFGGIIHDTFPSDTWSDYLIFSEGISFNSNDHPLGMIQNWGFTIGTPHMAAVLVFEFGFVKIVSSQFVKIGVPKQRRVPTMSVMPPGIQGFTLGAPNDLWGIPASEVKGITIYPYMRVLTTGEREAETYIIGPVVEAPTYHQAFSYRDGACLAPTRP